MGDDRDILHALAAINSKLGELNAKAEEADRQRHRLFKISDDLVKDVAAVKGVADLAAREMATLRAEMDTKVHPQLQASRDIRNRGIGIISTVGVAGGIVGWNLPDILSRIGNFFSR